MMWMLFGATAPKRKTAENQGKPGLFSASKPAGRKGPDCYTFETFTAHPRFIRTACYHYH
jgi:hypothetical protein